MKLQEKITQYTSKKKNQSPRIESIQLDNEISLALESEPPTGDEVNNSVPEYFNNEPFGLNNA